MNRQKRKTMKLYLILMYVSAQVIGYSNAGDVCNNEDLIATSDLQLIFSPNFPRNYPNNVHCTSHITSPEDTVIELTFYHFQLEDSDDCNKDSLSITDGTHENLLLPSCGLRFYWPHYPDKIVSISNDMTITFATDNEGNSRGLNATFRAVQPSPQYVITAENSSIRVIPRFNDANFLITSVTIMEPLAVDYDPRTQYVYYSDRGAKTIGRILVQPSRLQTVLHSEYILEPFGLRIDVNSRLLYWTDAELGTISVSNLDGEYRNTIIHTELDKPGAIVTEPYKGYIYFTDWGTHPKIERADGDGRNRLVLVNSDIVSPRSLAVDLKERTLYWIDAILNSLERVNYDGTGRNILKFVFPSNVFSLVLDDDAFFCNGFYSYDPSNGYIHFFDRKLQSDGFYVRWGSEMYYKGISLRPRYEGDVVVPDTCPRADCDWLCLPTPNGQHTCLSDDTTPPVFLNCPENIIIWVAPGVSSSQVSWDDVSLEDDVDVIISSSHLSGSTFRLGTETVKIAARDFAGNMAWCNFSATVIEDNSPPVIISCPSDISVSLSSSAETRQIVTWDEPVLSDNAGDAYWLVGPSSSGTAFPIGSTHITYVASDRFGNQAQCSFTVTVSAFPQTITTHGNSQNQIQIAYSVAGFGILLGLLGLVAVILVSYTVCKRKRRRIGTANDQRSLNSTGTEVNLNGHFVSGPAPVTESSSSGIVTANTVSGVAVGYTKPVNEPYYMDSLN